MSSSNQQANPSRDRLRHLGLSTIGCSRGTITQIMLICKQCERVCLKKKSITPSSTLPLPLLKFHKRLSKTIRSSEKSREELISKYFLTTRWMRDRTGSKPGRIWKRSSSTWSRSGTIKRRWLKRTQSIVCSSSFNMGSLMHTRLS